jgi:hypothetical protein
MRTRRAALPTNVAWPTNGSIAATATIEASPLSTQE